MEFIHYIFIGFIIAGLFMASFFYFRTRKNIREGRPAVWPETMMFKNPTPAGRYLTTVGPNVLGILVGLYLLLFGQYGILK